MGYELRWSMFIHYKIPNVPEIRKNEIGWVPIRMEVQTNSFCRQSEWTLVRFFFRFVLLICTRIWRKFPEILARRRRRQIFRRFFIKENPLFLGVLAKDFFNSTLKNEKNRLRRTLFLWNPISFWNVGQKNEGGVAEFEILVVKPLVLSMIYHLCNKYL